MRVAGIGLLVVAAASLAHTRAQAPERVPVVLELFTSEGCSSCPPADTVLSKLAHDQPVPGVQIVALGLHVTYWDQLGWKDPASLAEATARQQDYGRIFGEDRVYTPQAVIDGRDELVGSDEAGITKALLRAAKLPHARVSVAAEFQGTDAVAVTVSATGLPSDLKEKTRTLIFVTEDGITSIVKRGENGGRTLHSDAVVRRVSQVLELKGIRPEWRRDRLRVVAVIQGEKSQRIVGAGVAPIQ